MEFFHYLEQTGFAAWIRESDSIWAYPTILFLHTIGLGIVVGINSAIDLRILGLASRLPLEPLEGLFPLMWVGFWINAASGTLLLIADASTKLANPVFYIKMGFIALAVVDVFVIRTRVFAWSLLRSEITPAFRSIMRDVEWPTHGIWPRMTRPAINASPSELRVSCVCPDASTSPGRIQTLSRLKRTPEPKHVCSISAKGSHRPVSRPGRDTLLQPGRAGLNVVAVAAAAQTWGRQLHHRAAR